MRDSETRPKSKKTDALLHHGGRLAAARSAFPKAPTPWLDLSTGVNPRAWVGSRAGLEKLRSLPDPADTTALETAAANAFGVDPASVVAIPGTEIGLRLMPRITQASQVAIVAPTYGGHVEAWAAAGARVTQIDRADLKTSRAEAIVIVNPNNPDGTLTSRSDIAAAAKRIKRQGGWMIVDEAFAEVAPEISVAAYAKDRLIVLRSFGKFYGLPGVRLGFIVADPKVIARVRAALGDWPVSADAIAMGSGAYADIKWRDASRARLKKQADRLDRLLQNAGLNVIGGTSLFRLVSTPIAAKYFQRLAELGILVRPFDYQPTWLRFGLPPDSQWMRLAAALKCCASD